MKIKIETIFSLIFTSIFAMSVYFIFNDHKLEQTIQTSSNNTVATLVNIKSGVRIKRAQEIGWIYLNSKENKQKEILNGESIFTGNNENVSLLFNKTNISLDPNTLIQIDQVNAEKQIHLESGHITIQTKEAVKIKVANKTISIAKDSVIQLNRKENQDISLNVDSGKAVVFDLQDKKTVTLAENQPKMFIKPEPKEEIIEKIVEVQRPAPEEMPVAIVSPVEVQVTEPAPAPVVAQVIEPAPIVIVEKPSVKQKEIPKEVIEEKREVASLELPQPQNINLSPENHNNDQASSSSTHNIGITLSHSFLDSYNSEKQNYTQFQYSDQSDSLNEVNLNHRYANNKKILREINTNLNLQQLSLNAGASKAMYINGMVQNYFGYSPKRLPELNIGPTINILKNNFQFFYENNIYSQSFISLAAGIKSSYRFDSKSDFELEASVFNLYQSTKISNQQYSLRYYRAITNKYKLITIIGLEKQSGEFSSGISPNTTGSIENTYRKIGLGISYAF